jgi:hypothetical protein
MMTGPDRSICKSAREHPRSLPVKCPVSRVTFIAAEDPSPLPGGVGRQLQEHPSQLSWG